eukprot:1155464-Pelagomonas_calceolata.AAC.3
MQKHARSSVSSCPSRSHHPDAVFKCVYRDLCVQGMCGNTLKDLAKRLPNISNHLAAALKCGYGFLRILLRGGDAPKFPELPQMSGCPPPGPHLAVVLKCMYRC